MVFVVVFIHGFGVFSRENQLREGKKKQLIKIIVKQEIKIQWTNQ